MNWVDGVILLSIGLGVLSGFRRGAILQAFGWGGFLVGLIVGSAVAPHIVPWFHPKSALNKTAIALGVFLGIAFLIEGLVAAVGLKLRKKIQNPGARHADAFVGALIAAFFALATSWFLGIQLARGPSKELARSINSSAILQTVDNVFPRPPAFLAAIGRFLNHTGLPEVFTQLNPSFAPGVEPPPPGLARDPDIVAAAGATYKIEGRGCGGVVDGSGFPLDGHTVVTAAHVVAGTRDQRVIEPDGTRHIAIVVYFDKNKDIAVLRVSGLPSQILKLDAKVATRGSDGAAIGYPGGGPRKTTPARVRAETEAQGRDIYSEQIVSRAVYVLASSVHPGNSGGPFVDVDGVVRGMIFAASATRSDEAYALAGSEVSRAYRAGTDRRTAVGTGSKCAV
ncbi:MAG: MarP family serine protease [Actinomycetota bacterium]|nr:MarP family serine protease [Actinomycetota bacterium]